jgi:hypothetical protein
VRTNEKNTGRAGAVDVQFIDRLWWEFDPRKPGDRDSACADGDLDVGVGVVLDDSDVGGGLREASESSDECGGPRKAMGAGGKTQKHNAQRR